MSGSTKSCSRECKRLKAQHGETVLFCSREGEKRPSAGKVKLRISINFRANFGAKIKDFNKLLKISEELFDSSAGDSMQSKISAFFKSPAHAPKSFDPASLTDGGNDELAIWEKKEHHIFNTYERRSSVPKMYAVDRVLDFHLLYFENCFIRFRLSESVRAIRNFVKLLLFNLKKCICSSFPQTLNTIFFLRRRSTFLRRFVFPPLLMCLLFIFIFYFGQKRIQGNTEEIHQTKKIIPGESRSKQESIITGRTIIKNKKRSYAQFHLDCGQSDFLLHNCSTCGVKFAPGDAEDEKAHKEFHKTYTGGLPFKRWTNERVVHMPNVKGDRIILVLQSDPLAQKNKVGEVVKMMEIDLGTGWIIHQHCKVYLFISQQRIVGCLVAEPIKEAFKVITCSVAGSSSGSRKKETNSFSTTLHFGDIIFRREVEKRTSSVNESAELDTTHGGAILCDDKAVTALCGIRGIWVTSSNRRKGVATQLLDAVRKSFCMGFVLDHSQLAFSQPTSVGMALASSYTGTGSFLVYRANKTGS